MQLRANRHEKKCQEISPLDRWDTFRLFHASSFISRLCRGPCTGTLFIIYLNIFSRLETLISMHDNIRELDIRTIIHYDEATIKKVMLKGRSIRWTVLICH